MRITRIKFTGGPSVQLDMPIVDLDPFAPYLLKSVDGLGPPQINLNISDTLYQGGQYAGRRPLNREVVARVGLNPDYTLGQTPGDLRDDLYGLLSNDILDECDIELYNGATLVGMIDGAYVKNFEINPFTSDPEVQITFGCTEPFIEAPTPTVLSAGLSTTAPIVTAGTAPSGFRGDLTFTADRPNFLMTKNLVTAYKQKFNVVYPFLAGDRLIFNTTAGTRFIQIVRGSSNIDLLGYLSSDSVWLQLHKGVNAFTMGSSSFTWNGITYTKMYWGI